MATVTKSKYVSISADHRVKGPKSRFFFEKINIPD